MTDVMAPRCHCRAGCLCFLRPSDVTVSTVAGDVLAVHLPFAVASPTPVERPVSPLSVLAKVGAA